MHRSMLLLKPLRTAQRHAVSTVHLRSTIAEPLVLTRCSPSFCHASNMRLFLLPRRFLSSSSSQQQQQEKLRRAGMKEGNRRALMYLAGVGVAFLGLSYAAVPLYKIFCQVTGFGGTTQRADIFAAEKLTPREDAKPIRITFDGGVSAAMPWSFRPQQRELVLVPGETALAFYTAKNKTDRAITGVATYNVYPPKAGVYFNKIQCFCFEEQRLKAQEEIDMPVFFFIDPEICEDPTMTGVHNITLSYTFFKTDDVNDDDVDDEE